MTRTTFARSVRLTAAASIALAATALLGACGSDSASDSTNAPAAEQGADTIDSLRADLMCATGSVWEQDQTSGSWVGYTCPEGSGPTSTPPRLYVFATSTDQQLFSDQAAWIAEQQNFSVVIGPQWIAFGFPTGHRDFLLNAVNQGGQLVQ